MLGVSSGIQLGIALLLLFAGTAVGFFLLDFLEDHAGFFIGIAFFEEEPGGLCGGAYHFYVLLGGVREDYEAAGTGLWTVFTEAVGHGENQHFLGVGALAA